MLIGVVADLCYKCELVGGFGYKIHGIAVFLQIMVERRAVGVVVKVYVRKSVNIHAVSLCHFAKLKYAQKSVLRFVWNNVCFGQGVHGRLFLGGGKYKNVLSFGNARIIPQNFIDDKRIFDA